MDSSSKGGEREGGSEERPPPPLPRASLVPPLPFQRGSARKKVEQICIKIESVGGGGGFVATTRKEGLYTYRAAAQQVSAGECKCGLG